MLSIEHPGTTAAEPPLGLIDAIYEGIVRQDVAAETLRAVRDWLGAERLHLLEDEGDAPFTADARVTRLPLNGAGSSEPSVWLIAVWPAGRGADADAAARLDMVRPHLSRAFAFRHRLLDIRRGGSALGSALDRLAIGAITIRPDRRPIDTNVVGREILDGGDGLILAAGKVCAEMPSDQQSLRALVAMMEEEEDGCRAMRVKRGSGRPALELIIAPRPRTRGLIRHGLRLYIRDPEWVSLRSPEVLQDLYGLTCTEAAIALHLANGRTQEETERALGIRHNTLRAHLRAIYAKTGTVSHADLLHVLLTGACGLATGYDARFPHQLEPITRLSA